MALSQNHVEKVASFEIETCDVQNLKSVPQIESNLNRFQANSDWLIEVIFTDPDNNNHLHKKQYRLRNITEM